MADLGDPAWRGMVCVETGNVADNEVRLAADGEHQMSTVIIVDAGAVNLQGAAQLGGDHPHPRSCS